MTVKTVFAYIAVSIPAIMMLACSTTTQTPVPMPTWLNGEHEKYDSQNYLTGKGRFKYLHKAKQLAKDDILASLSTTLTPADSEFIKQKTSYDCGTPQIKEHSKIIESWKHPVTDEQHALAVVPRKLVARLLANDMRKLDDKTRAIIETSATTREKLQKISLAHEAIQIQLQRKATELTLLQIYPESKRVPYVWKQGKLGSDYKKLLSRLRLKPLITHDATLRLKPSVISALQRLNITADNSSSPDYILETTLNIDKKDLKSSNGYITKGEVILNLLNRKGRRIGKHRWPLRVLSQSTDMTDIQIEKTLTDLFAEELMPVLFKMQSNNSK